MTDRRLVLDVQKELMARSKRDPDAGLIGLRCQVVADQYLGLYKLWNKYVPKNSTVLDWGTGNGHFSYFLTRSGHKASGFDFQDFGLRDSLGDDYDWRLADATDPVTLPFANENFDAVSSVGVLEHVRETGGDERESLREIVRVLKPGGVFVCVHFPNKYSYIDMLAARFPEKHRHIYRYTGADIRSLADDVGLELLEMRLYGALPRLIWNYMPQKLRDSSRVSALWNALDAALRLPFQGISQNYLWVGRKPATVPPEKLLP